MAVFQGMNQAITREFVRIDCLNMIEVTRCFLARPAMLPKSGRNCAAWAAHFREVRQIHCAIRAEDLLSAIAATEQAAGFREQRIGRSFPSG